MKRLALAALLVFGAAPAEAATYCVGTTAPGCVDQPTLSSALAAAGDSPGADTIRVGRRTESANVADEAGEPVHIVGAGRAATEIDGNVDLNEARSSIGSLAVRDGLALRGDGRDLRVTGAVRLRDGSALRSSVVAGALVTAGAVQMHSVAVTGSGVEVESGRLTAAHVSVVGSGAAGVRGTATISDSVVWGFTRGVSGAATVTRSLLPESGVDPGFTAAPGDLRPRPGSPLVEAGDPQPLRAEEPELDAAGDPRAMDGDGDGIARRDLGAHERRPPAPPSTAGNLLANPGAEQGTAAENDSASPAPPRWRRVGGFTSVRYGTVVGLVTLPSLAASDALGAGEAFFAAGPSGAASATQVVDVSGWAPEIDARAGFTVRLSALLGGFRLSEDHATVTARFVGPAGIGLGTVALDTVTAAERGNATMLVPRIAAERVPRLTRSIAVTIHAGPPGGSYNDAYVDDVALVPSIPTLGGVPARARGKRRFGGVAVLARRIRVARGLARVPIGCPTSTARRCAGTITLARRRTVVLGTRVVQLRPGEVQRIRIPLSRRERRQLGRRARPGHVYAAVRDARGNTRTKTAPVRIVRR